jgi:hypothetical protein
MQHLEKAGQPIRKQDGKYIDNKYIDTHSTFTTETAQQMKKAGKPVGKCMFINKTPST